MLIKRRLIASRTIAIMFGLSYCVIAVALPAAFAQTPEEATRRLWDTAFISPGKSHAAGRRTHVNRKPGGRSYRIVTPNIPTTGVAADTVVGLTVWRLRRSTSADSGERLIVHEGTDAVEWLPERISADTRLAEGDRLRISVEAARTGYLYVIDREQYADGSLGEPYLIFPTTRTLNGNNEVKVGKVIEIPAQDDRPPYFTLRRSKPVQVAEVLSVLVTSSPLEAIQITDRAQKLAESQVAAWEQSWSTQVGLLELESGAGRPWTKEEKDAGADATKALKPDAPAPQVLYYRPNAKASEPLLVKVHLRYRYPVNKTTR
jgi:hypothetical protein